MSRSYKKHPSCGDDGSKKFGKKQANKRVRNKLNQAIRNQDYEYTLLNSEYKKEYESWNICDFWFIASWEEYWQYCLENYVRWTSLGFPEEEPDKEKEYKYWYTHYRRK